MANDHSLYKKLFPHSLCFIHLNRTQLSSVIKDCAIRTNWGPSQYPVQPNYILYLICMESKTQHCTWNDTWNQSLFMHNFVQDPSSKYITELWFSINSDSKQTPIQNKFTYEFALGPLLRPKPCTTLTKRRLYWMRRLARPVFFFFFSCLSTWETQT